MTNHLGAVDGRGMSSLQESLSSESSITVPSQPLRWSEYGAPQPGFLVHPAAALDVSKTVRWADKNNVSFLLQNGGNGWADTFSTDSKVIVIQLDKLRSVTFNQQGTQAAIGGGALIGDVVPVAAAKGSLVLTGTCNCVGALGAILGGGYSSLGGQFGMGVDDVLSLEVVKANGDIVTLSST